MASLLLCAASSVAADATYDGARVHYESYGKGTEAVVFIHGWTCDLTFWRGQAPVYQAHRALLIDLPGHGESGKPGVAYTQERFARGVDAVMRDAGVSRAVLVGHSMGGPVALTFLRLFPAKTKAIVLVDAFLPQPPKDDAARQSQRAQWDSYLKTLAGPDAKDTVGKMIDGMFSSKTTPETRLEIRTKMLAAPTQVRVSAMKGMSELDPPKAGETYQIPVMVFVTEQRPGLDAQLRGIFPNLRSIETWTGYGHFLMMEDPARFNKALEQFLGGL